MENIFFLTPLTKFNKFCIIMAKDSKTNNTVVKDGQLC